MTEDEKERDNIKEEQKALFEYLRMVGFFIIGLTASATSFYLRDDFSLNNGIIVLFILNLVFLSLFVLLLIFLTIKISSNISKLTNL